MEQERGEMPETGSAGYVWRVTVVAALGGLLFGYDTGVISGAIEYLQVFFSLNADMKGWAASSALVGCIIGACFAGALSDALGRRKVLLLSAVLFTVSALWSAFPRSLSEFAIARMLGGFGVGAASMLSPLYIAEIAPAGIRGRLVSVNQLAIVFGFLVVYFVNMLVAQWGERTGGEAWNIAQGWRWMFGSETLPAALFMVLLFFVPESPRWLVKRGRTEEARQILARVGGAARAEIELAEIADAIAHEERSVKQLLGPGLRVAMMIGIALAILQQITGINAVLYYAPALLATTGLGAAAAIAQTVIVGVVNVSFTLVAIAVVDRVGRKALLLIGSVGMGLSMFLLGGAFALGLEKGPWVLVFMLTYVASFAMALGPVVWVVLAEIFPTRVRGLAMSVATVSLWIACFLVTQFVPRMLENYGGQSYFIFAVTCAICFVFVALFVPETKGKTLEEIEKGWIR